MINFAIFKFFYLVRRRKKLRQRDFESNLRFLFAV